MADFIFSIENVKELFFQFETLNKSSDLDLRLNKIKNAGNRF